MGIHPYHSLRQLYEMPLPRALGKAVFLAFSSVVVLQLYRSILFFTTYCVV